MPVLPVCRLCRVWQNGYALICYLERNAILTSLKATRSAIPRSGIKPCVWTNSVQRGATRASRTKPSFGVGASSGDVSRLRGVSVGCGSWDVTLAFDSLQISRAIALLRRGPAPGRAAVLEKRLYSHC
jgi:hypothetical protein